MLRIKDKRGQFELGAMEIFFALTFLFASAIFLVILFYSWGQISEPLATSLNNVLPAGETSVNITQVNDNVDTGIAVFNVMYPFLILGLILFVIVSTFFTNSHPMFLFISVTLLAISILIGAIFSNIFQQLTVTSAFAASADSFNIIQLFMKNLPVIIGVVSLIAIFVLFAVGRGRGGATGGL